MINSSDIKREHDDIETVLNNVIKYLAYSRESEPKNFICDKPDADKEKSDIRSVILALIFFIQISNLNNNSKRSFYANSYLYKERECEHGENCPYVIGCAIFIWCSKKFDRSFISDDPNDEGKPLPDYYEKFSGCGFFHSEEEIEKTRKKVYTIMEKIYDKYDNLSQNNSHPIDIALSKINFFINSDSNQRKGTRRVRLFKLTNLSNEEKKDPRKRTFETLLLVYGDEVFYNGENNFMKFRDGLNFLFNSKDKLYIQNREKLTNHNKDLNEYYGVSWIHNKDLSPFLEDVYPSEKESFTVEKTNKVVSKKSCQENDYSESDDYGDDI